MVDWENDKPTVVALREIAEGHVTPAMLEEPDPQPEPPAMEFEPALDFRAPQLGLGE
jgi:DNA-directed RNA polymerase subunit omega